MSEFSVLYSVGNHSKCFTKLMKNLSVINVNSIKKCDAGKIIKLVESGKVSIIGVIDKNTGDAVLVTHGTGFFIKGLNSFMKKLFNRTGKLFLPITIEFKYSRIVNRAKIVTGEMSGVFYTNGNWYLYNPSFVMIFDETRSLFKLTLLIPKSGASLVDVGVLKFSFTNYLINELSYYTGTFLHNKVKTVFDYTAVGDVSVLDAGDPVKINAKSLIRVLKEDKVFYYWLFNDVCEFGRYSKCDPVDYSRRKVIVSNEVEPLSFDDLGTNIVFSKYTEPEELPLYFQYELFFKVNLFKTLNTPDDLTPSTIFSEEKILSDFNKLIRVKSFQQVGFVVGDVFYPVIAHATVKHRFFYKNYWYINNILVRVLSYNLIMNNIDIVKSGDIKIGKGRFIMYKFNNWEIGFSWNRGKKTLEYIGDDISLNLQ